MSIENTQDFAIVEVLERNVILEANEWDPSLGLYRVVTLYLTRDYAIELAEKLILHATGSNRQGVGSGQSGKERH